MVLPTGRRREWASIGADENAGEASGRRHKLSPHTGVDARYAFRYDAHGDNSRGHRGGMSDLLVREIARSAQGAISARRGIDVDGVKRHYGRV